MARGVHETDFHQLKELLQRDQRSELAELRAMVAEVEAKALHQDAFEDTVRSSLTHNLADVIHALPDDRRDRLNNELSSLLNDSMDSRIKAHEPALMDQMNRAAGGLVRTGIAQALAEFVQTIQKQISQQLSFRERAKSQVAAMRSGASERDIVLQRALEGRPKSALLIHRSTGLLIASADRDRAHQDGTDGGEAADFDDQDALKGSLITAIISFADEALSDSLSDERNQDQGGGLDTLSFGGRTLVLAAQPLTVLAVEYDGVPPLGVSSWLAQQLSSLSAHHWAALDGFVGDHEPAASARLSHDLYELLQVSGEDVAPQFPVRNLMKSQKAMPETRLKATWGQELQNALPMIALFLILIGGGFLATKSWRASHIQARAETLANAVARDEVYDLQLRYNTSQSVLSVRRGFVVGAEARVAIEQELTTAFPFATVELSGLVVLANGT